MQIASTSLRRHQPSLNFKLPRPHFNEYEYENTPRNEYLDFYKSDFIFCFFPQNSRFTFFNGEGVLAPYSLP